MKLKKCTSVGLVMLGIMFWFGAQPAIASVSVFVTPANQTVFVGSNPTLTASATTTAGEVITGYTWLMSSNGLNPFITVGNAAVLTITNIQTSQKGFYFVRVNYTSGATPGSIASTSIPINVQDQARITSQPQDLVRNAGTDGAFSVTALGLPPLRYQWRFNGTNLTNGGRVSGASGPDLAIAGLLETDSGNYDVVVSNTYAVVTSRVAVLSVVIPPFISAQPQNTTVIVGSNTTFSMAAGGSPLLEYRWKKGGVNLSNGGRFSGVTTPTLHISGALTNDAGIYSVSISNALDFILSSNATLTVGVPATITSATNALGQQGHAFSYTITVAGSAPFTFGATALPPGLSLNPVTGVIAGPPIVSGSFPVTIGVANQYGSDSKTLTINLASAVPGITSPLTAVGAENQAGFTYTITASNLPTQFEALGLPLGLTLNPNTGVIAGTPLYGGTFPVSLRAANAWGTGSNTLTLTLNYALNSGLAIADVAHTYSAPYLLDFSFSLRDDADPALAKPIVRPPDQFEVVCMEDGIPVGTETAIIFERGNKKQIKSFVVLDYTFSMLAAPGAIDNMQVAAKTLINELPANAQFGLYEFHADYEAPQLVTGFTSDKAFLSQAIDGIEENYVQGDYAGTRCYDALYAALNQFGPTNRDEQRYVVVMTDGNDDSSLLNTNDFPLDVLVALAQTNQVRIYCVAYGPNINVPALQQLTSQTLGHYYEAATTADLPAQFLNIVKDIDGQYLLRWATLKRGNKLFQPSFQVSLNGFTASFNTNVTYVTNIVVITNTPPDLDETNTTIVKITDVPDYLPPTYAGDVRVGEMRLVADADVGPQTIRLRATYVPRYVRKIKINYRANYACTVSLASGGPGEILNGWSLTQTNDGAGGFSLTLLSPNPTNLLTSIPYGALGDLVTFQFLLPDLLTGQQAFSAFSVDNTIYTNMLPNGQSFVLENTNLFITPYGPPPPHGTPIPWLVAYGFTNNFAAAELSDPNGNGLAVWQEYLAGLNPLDPNSRFDVLPVSGPQPGQHQIIFATVMGRSYRVEAAISLDGNWTVLREDIGGTGGDVIFTDLRDLSGVSAVYYRVAAY